VVSRYRLLCLLAVAAVACVLGARYLQGRAAMGSTVRVDERLIAANTDFAFRLFREVAGAKMDRNTVISPCGASMALSLAHDGALGKTQKAMSACLGFRRMSREEVNEANAALLANLRNPGKGVELAVANAVWVDRRAPIVPGFFDAAREFYGAESTNMDFTSPRAASLMDKWVRRKTKGRIRNIAHDTGELTRACLTNAVCFRGVWTRRFERERTGYQPFFLAEDRYKGVLMMSQEAKLRYCQSDSFDAAALPYGAGRMSMYVFVPKRHSSLAEFLQHLNRANWERWMSGFRKTKTVIALPRWKSDCRVDLRPACGRLGMEIAFDRDRANFRGMCRCDASDNVYLDALEQRTFVEVNEEGTEAAAATFVLFHAQAAPFARVIANRPFFFAIRDDTTGQILFMGTVVDPTVVESR